MKKIYIFKIIFIVIFFSGILFGCSSYEQPNTTSINGDFDMKAAASTVDTYMKYLMKNDIENIKKLYSKELLKSPVANENQNLSIMGYSLNDNSEVGKSGVFKVKIVRSDLSKPFSTLDEYSVKVIKEGNDYKIGEISSILDREAFVEKNRIKMRSKDNINVDVIIGINNMPQYVFSKDDEANVNKMSVPRSNFGILDFSYGGDYLALVTYDKNSYIGVVKIDESMEVQSDNSGSSDGQGNSESAQQEQIDEYNQKIIGKNIINLDILKNTKVEFLTFSSDEKFIVAQYTNDSIGHCIRMYKMDSGDIINFKFEDNFPLNKVDIVFSSFDTDTLNFDVISKANNSESLPDIIGKWRLNLKDFKAVKI
ncbi:hypothetical protein [Clostridium kluyveri]|uniref:Head-tail adaptor protein n=2 Tax=Clostridium kluyveri TaxID=1534 RepID=A5N4H5_CLOK5|nr:hypothetical protein [Clostridium kluyveri]EDK32206.1 Conserved hypothetical protein [Clostridium kluyveri DSM 555]